MGATLVNLPDYTAALIAYFIAFCHVNRQCIRGGWLLWY